MPPQTCALVIAVAGETETTIQPSCVRAAEWSDRCSIQGHNQIIHRPDAASAGCSNLPLLLCPLLFPSTQFLPWPRPHVKWGSGWAFWCQPKLLSSLGTVLIACLLLCSSRHTTLFPLF